MTVANFTINGTPSVDGNGDRLFVGVSGQTLTCTLEDNPAIGVLSVRFDILNPADSEAPLASKGAPQINWTSPATPSFLLAGINDDALIDLPVTVDAHSYTIRCTVSTADGPVVFERIVAILSSKALRKTIPAESVQALARGHSDDLNDLVDATTAALSEITLKPPEAFSPAGTYPVTYDGDAIEKGDTFRMTGAGTMGAVTVNIEDLLIALVDTPAQVDASWMVVESNRDQATESIKGVAELATQAETDTGTDDTRIVTPLKLANTPIAPAGSAGGQLGGTYPNPTVNAGADGSAIHGNVQGEIAAIAAGTVASGDLLVMEDIDDSNNKKKVTAQAIADLGGGGLVPDVFDDDVATTVNDATAVIGSFDTQADDTVAKLRVSVLAQDDTNNLMQSYDYIVQIKRNGAGVVTVDRVKEIDKFEQQVPASTAVTFVVNGNNIDITVLGIDTRTIEWRYQYEAIFISLGGG